MSLGKAIAERRAQLGWTLRHVASLLMISPQYLNDIELDRRHPTEDLFLEAIAVVLNLPGDYLYFLAGKLPPDIRRKDATPEQAVAVFTAMRRVLQGQQVVIVPKNARVTAEWME